MIVRNYLEADFRVGASHKGKGEIRSVALFKQEDFYTPLKFFHYCEIMPGTSIGYHGHRDDEELYVIVEGNGWMTVNGETREVKAGDVVLNKPYWRHGLENRSDAVLKVLVFEVGLNLKISD